MGLLVTASVLVSPHLFLYDAAVLILPGLWLAAWCQRDESAAATDFAFQGFRSSCAIRHDRHGRCGVSSGDAGLTSLAKFPTFRPMPVLAIHFRCSFRVCPIAGT